LENSRRAPVKAGSLLQRLQACASHPASGIHSQIFVPVAPGRRAHASYDIDDRYPTAAIFSPRQQQMHGSTVRELDAFVGPPGPDQPQSASPSSPPSLQLALSYRFFACASGSNGQDDFSDDFLAEGRLQIHLHDDGFDFRQIQDR